MAEGRYYAPSVGLGMLQALQSELARREEQRRRDSDEQLARDREKRLEESTRRQQEALDKQREIESVRWEYLNAPRGQGGLDPTRAARIRDLGMGSLMTTTPPQQGEHLGTDESGIDQYAVTPGVLDFGDTPEMTHAKQERADKETERLREQQRVQNAMLFSGTPPDARNYMEATGQLAPAGLFNQPEQGGTTNVYRTSRATGAPELVGTVPKGSHFTQEPAPPWPGVMVIGNQPFLVPKTGEAASPVPVQGGGTLGALPPNTPPEWQNVIPRSFGSNTTPQETQQKIATFSRLIQSGNMRELADQVRQTAIEGENVDVKNQVMARTTMRKQIAGMRATLENLKQKGVPTNVLAGSLEDIHRWMGLSSNPEYVKMAVQFGDVLRTYRRASTGLAFGEAEGKEYATVFPNYWNTEAVNMAMLDGLEQSIAVNENAYWEHKLGPDGARLVMGQRGGGAAPGPGGPGAAEDPAARARRLIQQRLGQ